MVRAGCGPLANARSGVPRRRQAEVVLWLLIIKKRTCQNIYSIYQVEGEGVEATL